MIVLDQQGAGTNGDAWNPNVWKTSDHAGAGIYDVQGNELRMQTPGTLGFYTDISQALAIGMPRVADAEVLARVQVSPSLVEQYIGVCVRCTPDFAGGGGYYPTTGIALVLQPSGPNWDLVNIVAGVQASILPGGAPIAYTFVGGQTVWVRLRAEGSNIMAKVWDDGTNEPSAWVASVSDPTVRIEGILALFNQAGSTGVAERADFAYLKVDDLKRPAEDF